MVFGLIYLEGNVAEMSIPLYTLYWNLSRQSNKTSYDHDTRIFMIE